MQQFIVFVLVFGVIVAIHEFGHFYFAKRAGILVREFAIGMGPVLFSTHKNGTTYTIRMLPLGGYVRLAGRGDDVEPLKAGQLVTIEQDSSGVITTINTSTTSTQIGVPVEVHQADLEKEMQLIGLLPGQVEPTTFSVSKEAILVEPNGTRVQVAPIECQFEQASVWHRMLVNIAGPINNFILGIVLFTIIAFLSGGVNTLDNRIAVPENTSPAYASGLKTGDKILSVDGKTTNTWREVSETLREAVVADKSEVTLVLQSGEQSKEVVVPFKDGRIGITQDRDTSLQAKLLFGFTQTYEIATSIFSVLGSIFTKGFDIQQFGGPVAIVQATSQVADQGMIPILFFTAMLSVNLGIMNLLPIPALDGGKIVLNIIEVLRGKPISPEKEAIVTVVGVVLLLLLMVAVTFNDISRLFQ